MGKLEDFLLKEGVGAATETEVVISTRFADENGAPLPFRIKSITESENKAIRKSCQTVTFSKKSHQREVETNADLYMNRLVIACTVEPNLKSAQLQERYGVMGAEALLDALLYPGEFQELLQAIQEINGFSLDTNALIDEAKN